MCEKKRNDFEVNLSELLIVFWKRSWFIFMTGVLFAIILALSAKFFVKPTYQSVTKLYVLSRENSDVLSYTDLQAGMQLTKDYAEVIKSRTVCETVIENLELNLTYEEMSENIQVVTAVDNRIITIKVLDEVPERARNIADEICRIGSKHIKRVMNSEDINIIDKANVPIFKYGPNIKEMSLRAFIFGTVIASVYVLITFLLNDTIQEAKDVEKYLELSVLGEIPQIDSYRNKKKKKKRR